LLGSLHGWAASFSSYQLSAAYSIRHIRQYCPLFTFIKMDNEHHDIKAGVVFLQGDERDLYHHATEPK
jgi:hypothetical protein